VEKNKFKVQTSAVEDKGSVFGHRKGIVLVKFLERSATNNSEQ